MSVARLINKNLSGQPFFQVDFCDTFWTRLKGLMFKPVLNPHEGIILDEKRSSKFTSSIHMLFMNFDIAVVWLDDSLRVVDTRLAKRWRFYYAPNSPARYILETHASHITDFKNGDQIIIESL